MLVIFKYFNFFQDLIKQVLDIFQVSYEPQYSNWLLPVGISFYTFQTISYAIDVYRKEIEVEKHFGKFALFVAFFPQLVAGPIERAKLLLPQINFPKSRFSSQQFQDGLILIIWGLFQKAVVADHVAIYVDQYYNSYVNQTGGALLFATYLFAIQIYCDFAGYSNMARGIAKMLGYELMENFKTPYFSSSITEFWRNWHISLSTWFKDYVYIPLGGNKKGIIQTVKNNMITMTLGGLWHGANWNFVMWGIINGFFISFEKIIHLLFPFKFKWLHFLKIFLVFNLICLTWIFFRSQSFEQAIDIIYSIANLKLKDLYFVIADNRFSTAILGSIFLFLVELQFPNQSVTEIRKKHIIYRYLIYLLLCISILLLGSSSGMQFIYFQF
jgi:D-alanyl-lipoteichoic acid acyltransferase DltB (MBOAT superfamily)